MKAVTLAVPCRADEPELGRTLDAALRSWRAAKVDVPLEVLVCLNGREPERAPAFAALRELAARQGVPLAHIEADVRGRAGSTVTDAATSCSSSSMPPPDARGGAGAMTAPTDTARAVELPPLTAPLTVVALTTAREGKPVAWNLLRAHARGDAAIFLDADVDVSSDAFGLLLAGLAVSRDAAVISPKTTCAPRPGAFERIMAVPYRIDFPNLSGQLYAARVAALPESMPDDLIEPERWLELVLGHERVGREPAARVVVRLPGTLRDFFRQRIRIEMGKVQLAADHPQLQDRGVPQPRWRAALALGLADFVRLGIYLVLRETAHAVAWRRWRRGRTAGVWRSVRSTKQWTTAGTG